MPKTELDPLRTILGVISNEGDSDLLLNAAAAAGLRFNAELSERGSYSHKNRIRELLPDILAAADALSEDAAPNAANALIAALKEREPLLERTAEALRRVGWNIQNGGLIVTEPEAREIFFPKQSQWDAFVVLKEIISEATTQLTLIDPYCDGRAFELLSARAEMPLSVRILCSRYASAVSAEARSFVAQHRGWSIEVRQARDFHDRFMVIDGDSCIHLGASINGAGKTAFMISRIEDQTIQQALLTAIETSWDAATPIS